MPITSTQRDLHQQVAEAPDAALEFGFRRAGLQARDTWPNSVAAPVRDDERRARCR